MPWNSGLAFVAVFFPGPSETGPLLMLTCGDLPLLQETLQALLGHLQKRGRGVNESTENSRPRHCKKVLGVAWWVRPRLSLRCHRQSTSPTHSKSVKEVQDFVGIWGHWQTFTPHLIHYLRPLHHLVKRKDVWAWGSGQQATFNFFSIYSTEGTRDFLKICIY